jgi:uncharacterized iron-regulated membrane protein
MKRNNHLRKLGTAGAPFLPFHSLPGLAFALIVLLLLLLLVSLYMYAKTVEMWDQSQPGKEEYDQARLDEYLSFLDDGKITFPLNARDVRKPGADRSHATPASSVNVLK